MTSVCNAWRWLRLTFLASALATVGPQRNAEAHTDRADRSIVLQVEPSQLVVLLGYRPASGQAMGLLLANAARSAFMMRDALAWQGTAQALAQIRISVNSQLLTPDRTDAKYQIDDSGRVAFLLLLQYSLPQAEALALQVDNANPRGTRISWIDRSTNRWLPMSAPTQGKWHSEVASFLLSLQASIPNQGLPCAVPTLLCSQVSFLPP